ncbi:MAG: hypothetical protein FWH14_05350 [Oscillospiraceae bacterium]|nr:hypothetical protein [Oscillospiraceae bacterium]
MANTRNKVAIVFDGVVFLEMPQRRGGLPLVSSQGRVFFLCLPQTLCIFLPLPLGEVSCVSMTERA